MPVTGWTLPTRVGWTLMLFGSVLLVFISSRYLTMNPEVYFPRQREVYEAHTLGLMVHIGAMILGAAIGPFQFLRSFRARYPAAHRIAGRVYLLGTMVGGLGGLYLAQYSASGAISDVGFGLLAVLVLLTGAMAYVRILQGRVQAHREWMTRSYALMLAAVTLRIYAPFLEATLGEQDGYAIVAWACWVPNIVVAEWMIRTRFRRRPEAPRSTRAASTP